MMRALAAHRVGCQPRPAARRPDAPPLPLGPDLPGAACKSKAPLFDNRVDKETADQRDQRHARAIELCLECPVFTQCKPGPDDEGIYAGVLYERKQRRCPCGKPLPDNASKQQRYCAPPCRQRKHITYQRRCHQCNQPYTTHQPKQRFCQPTCSDRWRKQHPKPPQSERLPGLTHCQVCGHPITRKAQQLGARNCSLRCRKRAPQHKAAA